MRVFGRALQLIGLIMLPLGVLYGQAGGPHAMALEFGLLIAGAVVFWCGWRLQQTRGG